MNPRKSGPTGLVYSTDVGRTCPLCRRAVAACICGIKPVHKGDGVVRVNRETQGRGGKAVTVVRGLGLEADALVAMGKRLKAACGAGGTAKDGVLEVQGDHVDKVIAWLQKEGRVVKRSGG
jgi:translation initiation factor 1